jgi:hypothetical protein
MCHKVIAQPIEEQDEPKEVSNMGEDQSHVTISNNQDIMHGNSHYHQRPVCIVVLRTIVQSNV